MFRSVIRWLPAAIVAVLMITALASPARLVRASNPVGVFDASICSPVQQGGVDTPDSLVIGAGEGISQRIDFVGNIETCSLLVRPTAETVKRLDLVYWDAQALAPSATLVALRTLTDWATSYAVDASRLTFSPPVVMRAAAGVAEPPPTETAFEYRVLNVSSELGRLDAASPAAAPTALQVTNSGQYLPVAGAHPVFAHSVCGGDESFQALRVVQCVMSTDTDLDPTAVQYVQRFRLPVAATLQWVEYVPVPYLWVPPLDHGQMQIFDAEGGGAPGADLGTPIASADFTSRGNQPTTWMSHYALATFPVLEAHHDYWLSMSTHSDYHLLAHQLTGSESADFQQGIGPLYRRDVEGGAFSLVPDRVMSFRVIGEPTAATGVDLPPTRPAELQLAASPNPTRGTTVIAWSGARDQVRFEVMDARGRRVSSGSAGVGASGRWIWNGRGDGGRALPPGMYFVRARDEASRNASVRVTLVR